MDTFLQERLLALYTTNPPWCGTKPENKPHLWKWIIANRTNCLSDGDMFNLACGYYPLVKIEVEYPRNEQEEQAIKWFNDLTPEGKLAQIKFRYQDWTNEQQQELAKVGGW